MGRQLPPEQRQLVIDEFVRTGSIRASAEATGVNYHKVRRTLIAAGVLDIAKQISPQQRADLLDAYAELGSVKAAADQVGISKWAASRALHKAGVEVKRRGPTPKRKDTPDLGQAPDSAIAEREGVSRQAIRRRRLRRGIPAYQGGE